MLENISLNFSDTGFCNCTKRGEGLFEIGKNRKKNLLLPTSILVVLRTL